MAGAGRGADSSARTVARLVKLGLLEPVKVLGSTRYRMSELQAIAEHGTDVLLHQEAA